MLGVSTRSARGRVPTIRVWRVCSGKSSLEAAGISTHSHVEHGKQIG